ncbi:DUF2147 domain-containing protein [Jannaschia sp. M317]|uniref:DUF2147 domain-containing protein n=1 Tax=Jannaschia sp. M317 TaxID=2867011 RepID=UPI0021A8939C|nr:DUF2147 domain-containing protein [Jannaschia sp. M317]UWQ19315.1 DUF2147 domain-containing protein [Jannaschia sp. M317]
MKRFALVLAAVFAMVGAANADPIEGVWQTEPDDGAFAYVTIAPCGGNYCGTITRTFNSSGEYNSPNKGKQLVRDMAVQGDGRYEGRVWRPSNDKVYLGKIQIQGNAMALRGCVAGGLICAKQNWVRVQ